MSLVRLVFLGPPGSGKGTQARRLADRFALVPLSSGDILRDEIRAETTIGKHAQSFVESGRLVPDDVISGVMLAGLRRLPRSAGFILDGFPRTVPQAEALDQGLRVLGLPLEGVVDFALDDAAILERITTRRICSACKTPYNVRFSPPRKPDVCDRCGAPVVQREDDREEVVLTRLDTYRRQTAPLTEYYSTRGLLYAIDAGRPPEAIERDLAAVILSLEAR